MSLAIKEELLKVIQFIGPQAELFVPAPSALLNYSLQHLTKAVNKLYLTGKLQKFKPK